ncbi:MAG: VOC family protein [Bacillota bacterium]|nr:VOC family protein [Bacillota bacterium]MDI3317484.1 VOC family protein [Bacillota bacterium]
MIERIDNVGVATRRLEAMERFYGLLGFEVVERDATPGVLMAAGSARLYLFETRAEGAGAQRRPELVDDPPGLDHLSFWVSDVDDACRRLREQGVVLTGEPEDQPWGARACSLNDPDGNLVFLLGPRRGR